MLYHCRPKIIEELIFFCLLLFTTVTEIQNFAPPNWGFFEYFKKHSKITWKCYSESVKKQLSLALCQKKSENMRSLSALLRDFQAMKSTESELKHYWPALNVFETSSRDMLVMILYFSFLCLLCLIRVFSCLHFSHRKKASRIRDLSSEEFKTDFWGLSTPNFFLKPRKKFLFLSKYPLCRHFLKILQTADIFCRIFSCKMFEFSMILFKRFHACILHALLTLLTAWKLLLVSSEAFFYRKNLLILYGQGFLKSWKKSVRNKFE